MTPAITAGIITIITVCLLFSKHFPRCATASMGAMAMIVFGVLSPSKVFNQYSSSTIVVMMCMMIVGAALFETGAAMYIGNLLAKITGGTELGILIAIMIFGSFVSAFITLAGAFFMFMPIIISITLAAGLSYQKTLYAYAVSLFIGQQITLIGGNGNMVSHNMLLELGYEGWGFFELLPYSIFMILILIPATVLIACRWKFIIPGKQVIPTMAGDITGKEVPKKITGPMATSMIILIAAIILMAMDMDAAPMEVIAAIAACLCLFTNCVTYKQAVKSVDFNALMMIAGMTAVAKGIQDAGTMELIVTPIIGALNNLSPVIVILVIYIITAIGTQFMSNSAWVAVMSPLVIPLAGPLGIPVKAMAATVLLGSSAGLVTPMANSIAAPIMEMGEFSLTEFAKTGLFQAFFSMICAMLYIGIFLL